MVHLAVYPSPFGMLEIGCEENKIVSIRCCGSPSHSPCAMSELANRQLQEYFRGERKVFDLPLRLSGTPFQKAVWEELLKIPYGEVRTYGQIAAAIGRPKACRAVGQAVHGNPFWIVIPCHRVIGSNQKLTGYAGGLDMKQALLDLERNQKNPEA